MNYRLIVLTSLVLASLSSTSSAQTVKFCIDFNSTEKIFDFSTNPPSEYLATPSTLDGTQKEAIDQLLIQKFAPVVGEQNVIVEFGDCVDSCALHIIVSGGTGGPDSSYGYWQFRSQPAIVNEGMFKRDGFIGAALVNAIGETIAHLAGHMYGLGHSPDPNDLMTSSDKFSVASRLTSNRSFSITEVASLKLLVPICPAPSRQTGPVQITLTPGGPHRADDTWIDPYTSLANGPAGSVDITGARVGVTATDNNFLDADDDDYETEPHAVTLPPNQGVHLRVKTKDDEEFELDKAGKFFLANGGGDAMLAADPRHRHESAFSMYFHLPLFLAQYAKLGSMFVPPPAPIANTVVAKGGDAFGPYTLFKRNVRVDRPDALQSHAEYEFPSGSYAVDIAAGPAVSSATLHTLFIHLKILLNDGSVLLLQEALPPGGGIELRELAHYPRPAGADPYTTWNRIKGDPYILGGNVIYSYDSAQNQWNIDSAGLSHAYAQDIELDSNQTLYAATDRGFYIQPAGSAFHKSPFVFPNFARSFTAVFVDSKNHIHLQEQTNLWRSTDGGTTFSLDTAGLRHPLFNGTYRMVKFGEDALGNLYAIPQPSDGQPGVFQQLSNSQTWKLIAQSVAVDAHDKSFTNIFTSVAGNATILSLGTAFGSYTSTDHGATWSKDHSNSQAGSIYSIAKTSSNKIFLGTDLGIFSGWYGDTSWKQSFPSSGYMSANPPQFNLYLPLQNYLYSDVSGNLYTLGRALPGNSNFQTTIATSLDNGATWNEDSAGIALIKGKGLYYVSPQGKQFIALNDGRGNHVYSKSSGGSWALDQTGFSAKNAYDAPVSMIASTATTAELSTTAPLVWKYDGSTWAVDTAGLNGAMLYPLAASQTGELFGGTDKGGIVHRTGSNWSSIPLPSGIPFGATPFYLAVDNTGALFADWVTSSLQPPAPPYTGHGLWFTKDLGQHWTSCDIGNNMAINGLTAIADTVYLLTDQGYFDVTSTLWATAHVSEGPLVYFDTTRVGSTATKTITITNFGNDTLHISAITSTGAYSVMPGATTSAPPHGSVQRQVQFSPTSAGMMAGMAVIASNSTNRTDTVFFGGVGSTTGAVSPQQPATFSLDQNYPNPFNPSTAITYTLPDRGAVLLTVDDMLGRRVTTLVDEIEDAGTHSVTFNSGSLVNSVYSYTLTTGNFSATRNMVLLR